MPIRSWMILLWTAIGLVDINWGLYTIAPQYHSVFAGLAILLLVLVYARLTGLPWLPQIVRIIGDIMGRAR